MTLKAVAPVVALVALICVAAHAASPPAVESERGMVVTAQALATRVGADILAHNGNAIDAAVAVGYAEAVVNPCCGNIGGGGFMLIHIANTGRDVAINFRERAPAAATASMYLDATGQPIAGASLDGYRAVATPGTVLGLDAALAEYGTMTRTQAMAPAIALARDGFILTRPDADIIDAFAPRFAGDPEAAHIFLRPDGKPLQPGDRLIQSDLAATLQAIADNGPDAFYKGALPAKVEVAMRVHGGILTAADFADYRIEESSPLSCAYRGYMFLAPPPPSSGGVTLCEMLNILEGYDLRGFGFHSAMSMHLMVEAMRRAYFDRNANLGDPDFVHNPLDHLLSKDYAAELRAAIAPDKATPDAAIAPGAREKAETTHYSVIDRWGDAVSATYTINGPFGAGVMAPSAGFFLNDEMDDFTTRPASGNLYGLVQGAANAIAPGKRPLSSMAPTLVMKDGRVVYALGSPGGSRIITAVLETAVNLIDYGLSPQEAVDAPRFHHQGAPNALFVEPLALSPDTARLLAAMGYKIIAQPPWGAVELIAAPAAATTAAATGSFVPDVAIGGDLRPGFVYGANDDRRPAGLAAGD
ncbi:MAG: gamma-glutamyltransferase [Bradyrhizobium sp.]|nr:MAG: gamma-glutamyltransferase [Bradyrhizobium sp.]